MLLNQHPRPTRLHYRILALTWAGWLFDFYDLILYTFLLAPISAELGLGREAHALMLGASLGATAVGGALFGYLADRFGRKAVLQWSTSPTAPARCSAASRPAQAPCCSRAR